MKTKVIQFIPAILALAAVGFSYFSQWCTRDGQVCARTVLDQMFPYITNPLYFFALYFLPIAIVLIFVSRNVFISWLKLAVWAVPLLFVFIATQPVYATHILSTNRADSARFAAEVFTALSLALIIWKSIAARRR